MKPHKLTLQAFGPFADKQVIHFDKFSDIFLISGPTGAGKTTIFDGMMFALYGTLPGTRDSKSILSTFVTEYLEPFAEFIFSIKGVRYKIRRIPYHSRPARRGEGRMVDSLQQVEFYVCEGDNWDPVTGKQTEIDKKIEELIHLTAEEFSKIILLPQGEFQRFLVADTKDKMKILEKLFPTHDHESIACFAKELEKEAKNNLKKKEEDKKNLLERYDPDNYEKQFQHLSKEHDLLEQQYKISKKKLEDIASELGSSRELDTLFTEYEKGRNDLDILKKRSPEIEKLQQLVANAGHAKDIAPHIKRLREIEDDLQKNRSEIAQHKDRLTSEEKELKEVEKQVHMIPAWNKALLEARDRLVLLKKLLPARDKLVAKEKDLKNSMDRQNAKQELFDKTTAGIKKVEDTLQEQKKQVRERKERDNSFEGVVESLHKYTIEADIVKKRDETANQVKVHQDDLQKCRDALLKQQTALKVNITERDRLQQQKESSFSATLASKLEAGRPCPVCGSTEHPDPASTKTAPFSDEELLQTFVSNVDNTQSEIAKLTERIKIIEEQIKNYEKELKGLNSQSSRKSEELDREIAVLEKEKERLTENRKQLKVIEEEITSWEDRQVKGKKQQDDIRNELTGLKVDLETLKSEVTLLKDELKKNPELDNDIRDCETEINNTEKMKSETEERYRELQNSINGLKQVVGQVLKQGTLLDERHKVLEIECKEKLAKTPFKNLDEAHGAIIADEQYTKTVQEIEAFKEAEHSLGAKLELLDEKLRGKKRPDIAAIESRQKTVGEELDILKSKGTEIVKELDQLGKYKTEYDRLMASIMETLEETRLLIRLSDDLNGQNPKMLSFQNYILGGYLRKVVYYASRRFQIMTEGRYEFLVNEEITHGSKQAGLDLDVLDFHSGRKRSVKSLSGGEKFLASISLALGLSDVIQMRAGAIELDSIFIDEGFGSLDAASLDRALTILDTIREDRMVGIISHVSELQTRIPEQIKVSRSTEGSRVKLVV